MYIVVWADLWSTGINEYSTGLRLTQQNLAVPDDLWCQIQEWVKMYDPIISMTVRERLKNLEIIRELDKQGLELAELLRKLLKPDIRVSYHSEGLLHTLDNIEEFDAIARMLPERFDDLDKQLHSSYYMGIQLYECMNCLPYPRSDGNNIVLDVKRIIGQARIALDERLGNA